MLLELFGEISEGLIKIISFLHDVRSNTCKTRMQIRQKYCPVKLDKQAQPTYRKTLAEHTCFIYITNETNTRNKAGMKLLFAHVLYLSYTVKLFLSFVRRSARIIQKSFQILWIYLSHILICI